jgi:Trk K+ transport system NAD-binding subunit
MAFGDISNLIIPAIILSLFVLIGNPLIVIILMGLMGYSKKTGFMAGLTVAQISEFSLILIALGFKTGSLSQEILSLVTIIGLITIAGSTYLIIYSDAIFNKLSGFLGLFERKKIKEKEIPKKKYNYILLGYNRIGFSVVKAFSKITKNFLVVDYNPKVVKELKEKGINAVYGDVDDCEFLEDLGINKASLIVSTVPDKESNRIILSVLNMKKNKPLIMLTSRQIRDALELYESGADYVILPHFLGGEFTSRLIEKAKTNRKRYETEKKKELKILRERIKKGHEHPKIEKDK